jgi:8-oxo-dGTP diphosphatase
MKHYEVVAAIIVNGDKILCVQRDTSKYSYISHKFEFPGGKIEQGETKMEALTREIVEELNLEIEIKREFLSIFHAYPDFEITMHSFLCRADPSRLKLKEHIDFKWIGKEQLSELDWAAADLPIVEKLISEVNYE